MIEMSFTDLVEQSELVSITSEVVHNWLQRHSRVEPYISLPARVRDAIKAASILHHQEGKSARELATELAAQYPENLVGGRW